MIGVAVEGRRRHPNLFTNATFSAPRFARRVSLRSSSQRLKRKPRTISISVPTPIPLPPQAPSILRCLKVRVDGVQRIVKAHFYPPFKDLFKNPQSEQKVKDKTLILDYLKAVMSLEDVEYVPTGVASTTTNPWSSEAPKQGGAVGPYSQNIVAICSVCHGCETDHSQCVRNQQMAIHGMENSQEMLM